MGLVGTPYRWAGTRKTETVKTLGKALGRNVHVFCCDSNLGSIDVLIGKIFVGLLMSRAWRCFDEFNRLSEDQISALNDHIRVIQNVIIKKTAEVVILEQKILINFSFSMFITNNPADNKYRGRLKIPENVNILFQPVAMIQSDKNTLLHQSCILVVSYMLKI